MLISTKGRYALRTLIDMAERQSKGFLPLKEIALRQDISEKYLESIVKLLVTGGIVTGVRGKGGGSGIYQNRRNLIFISFFRRINLPVSVVSASYIADVSEFFNFSTDGFAT